MQPLANDDWAVLRDEATEWGEEGAVGRSRRFSVIVLFLIHTALAKVEPLVRQLWERGGVSVVTFCYHFKGWAYDRWDADFEIRIIDPKAP